MTRLLLLHGADPNQKELIEDNTPLHEAIGLNNSGIVKLLLAYGASPNLALQYCFTPLMAAAQMEITCRKDARECLKIVHALLDKNANHAVTDLEHQVTALDLAVYHCNVDVVYLLLKAGADPNAAKVEQKTPLYWILCGIEKFVREGCQSDKLRNAIAELLLCHGAQLSKTALKNIDLDMVLVSAITTGDVRLVQFSLDEGANPNYRNGSGDTPLHCVMRNWQQKSAHLILQLLLAHDATIELKNEKKFDALDIFLQSFCNH